MLLRLPALRSIGLKCVEHLFFYKLIKDDAPAAAAANNAAGAADGSNGGGTTDAARGLDVFIKEILED